MDSFYTPPELASKLVGSCKLAKPIRIADFAAGDGALLRAAHNSWPKADLIAMDLDRAALGVLSRSLPNAVLLEQDFLQFYDDLLLRNQQICFDDCFDLVLLNPPFSCRGKVSFETFIDGQVLRSSRAMAFVARALTVVRPGGELLAILPSSCLTSQRDKEIRNFICRFWQIEELSKSNPNLFSRCDVSVDLVRFSAISDRRPILISKNEGMRKEATESVRVMRGTVPVKFATKTAGNVKFIHTTNLRGGRLVGPTIGTAVQPRLVAGDAVLIPRVGKPRKDKIVLNINFEPMVLSDCVIALQADHFAKTAQLADFLRDEWDDLSKLYTGSCARYLTLDALSEFLVQRGMEAVRVKTLYMGPPTHEELRYIATTEDCNTNCFAAQVQ